LNWVELLFEDDNDALITATRYTSLRLSR